MSIKGAKNEGGDVEANSCTLIFSAMIDASNFQKSKHTCPKQKWCIKFQQNKNF